MFGKKKQPPIKSLIAHGTLIQGHIEFSEGLRIDGMVQGDIRATAQPSILVISETAKVTGEIHADHVIINGTILGPVFATTLLELQPKACIEGDVAYRALEMHQGATITGQLRPTIETKIEAAAAAPKPNKPKKGNAALPPPDAQPQPEHPLLATTEK